MSARNEDERNKERGQRETHDNHMSWKAFAGSAASRAKDYIASREYKNTYDNFSSRVSDTISRNLASNANESGDESDGDPSTPTRTQTGLGNWARQKIAARKGSGDRGFVNPIGTQNIHIFPGWAVRRYDESGEEKNG